MSEFGVSDNSHTERSRESGVSVDSCTERSRASGVSEDSHTKGSHECGVRGQPHREVPCMKQQNDLLETRLGLLSKTVLNSNCLTQQKTTKSKIKTHYMALQI